MADRWEIEEIFAGLEAYFTMQIADSNVEVWFNMFKDVDGKLLNKAVRQYLRKAKTSRLPMPGKIFELIEKLEAKHHSEKLSGVKCDDCKNLGMKRVQRPHPKNPLIDVDVMVTCSCRIGKSKAEWLKKKKEQPRLDWSEDAPKEKR